MNNNDYQNLGPKTLLIFIMGGIIFPIMILILLLVLWYLTNIFSANDLISPYLAFINSSIPILLAIDLVFFILMFFIAWWQYHNFKFKIADEAFKVTRGILTREETAIPYRRIESVNLKETLLYQIFGVSRLTIEIVSDDENEVEIKANSDDEVLPAIDRHLALNIQEELTQRANIQKMRVHEQ